MRVDMNGAPHQYCSARGRSLGCAKRCLIFCFLQQVAPSPKKTADDGIMATSQVTKTYTEVSAAVL